MTRMDDVVFELYTIVQITIEITIDFADQRDHQTGSVGSAGRSSVMLAGFTIISTPDPSDNAE
jgi:hypothetical protein